MMLCDFCSVHKVTWSYPCKSFVYIPDLIASEGEWAACDTCHDFIEKGMNQVLAYYAIKKADFEIPFEMMLELHDMFRANRIGEAEKICLQ